MKERWSGTLLNESERIGRGKEAVRKSETLGVYRCEITKGALCHQTERRTGGQSSICVHK